MKGIRFGGYHSFNDLRLILASKTIGTPSPKTETIDIPGGDGVLDLTEYFGDVKYENRPLSFVFSATVPRSELHGRKLPIIDDEDPDWVYTGRISVSEWKAEKNIGKLTIDCDCEPYKMQTRPTVITKAVNGTEAIILPNSRKRTVPEVVISSGSGLNIVFGTGNVWDLGNGSYTLPELELVAGDNTVTVTGTGSITFTYTQGKL